MSGILCRLTLWALADGRIKGERKSRKQIEKRKKDRREGRLVKKNILVKKYEGKMREKKQRNQEQKIVDSIGGHQGPAP